MREEKNCTTAATDSLADKVESTDFVFIIDSVYPADQLQAELADEPTESIDEDYLYENFRDEQDLNLEGCDQP
jgi:hypothetical protein